MPNYALSDYIQLLVAGLSSGSIYVLIGLGLITIYNVTGIINLAQGEFVMLGAMLTVALFRLQVPLGAAAALAVVGVVLVGLLVHRLTIHPAHNAPDVTMIIITIGTSIAIRGLALLFWGTTPYNLPDFTPGPPVALWGAIVGRQRVWIMASAAVVLLLLYSFFEFTLLGKAVRACAINRRAAQILGINPQAMAGLAYGLGAGLSAVAGIVIAPLTLVSYDMGLALGLKGFVVAIMGGLTNMPAAVIGGLLLGVLESFSSALLSSGLKDGIAFLVLFAVLLLRTVNLRDLRAKVVAEARMSLSTIIVSRRKDWLGLAGMTLFLGTLPLWLNSPYALSTMILIGIYSIVTIGLCLLMGYAGQISLGQAAFFGLGAYGSGILTVRFGWSPWLALPAAAAVTAAVALLFGLPIFRLRGHYLAMGTLAFGFIVEIAMKEWKIYTGGPTGLPGIPRLTLGGVALKTDMVYYYLVWVCTLAALVLGLNIVHSRFGRALRAIRASEPAAQSLGIAVGRYKLLTFVVSAVFASVAGSLYAHYMIFISPGAFDFSVSVRLVLMAAVGGLASIWGAPLGTALVTLLTLVLREIVPLLTDHGAGEYQIIAYGALLVVIMIFMPDGLTASIARAWQGFGGLAALRARLLRRR